MGSRIAGVPGPASHGPHAPSRNADLAGERVRLLYAQAVPGLGVNLLLAALMVWLFSASTPAAMLLPWGAAVLAITALRGLLVRAYGRAPPPRDAARWCRRFVLGATLSGLAWGVGGVLLSRGESLTIEVLIAFILGALTTGAMPALASVPAAYATYAIATLSPIALHLALQGDHTHVVIGAMAGLYCAALVVTGRNYGGRVTSALRLAQEKGELAEELAAAHAEARYMNRELEARIVERKQVEGALRASVLRYRTLFEASPVSLWEEDWSGVKSLLDGLAADGVEDLQAHFQEHPEFLRRAAAAIRILSVNEATLAVYGARDKQQFLDAMHQRLQTEPFDSLGAELLAFASGRHAAVTESLDFKLDGTPLHVRTSVEIAEEHRDTWSLVIAALEDVTEARRLSAELSYQASHDPLTDLVNRREFERRLARVLADAHASGSEHVLCYLDLDQFKVINDTCGHAAGDELLRQLAHVLGGKVRRHDTLARLGGDEFGVLFEHCSLEKGVPLADALRRSVDRFRFVWEERNFSIGVSIGLVPVTVASRSIGELMSAADVACYSAKDQGRNRIHVYREDDSEAARHQGDMQWVARLRQALEEGRFELAYQPIVPVNPQRREGLHYEVLVRMRDEAGAAVSPGAFLPAAERYHLASKLDRWVLDAALGWLEAHPEHTGRLETCAINLSGHSLTDELFLRHVTERLARGSVPAEKICFEITETAAIANLASAARLVRELRALGCRFALDDFGSGLSSFAYLKQLPVDYLKIDGLFVKDIADDPVDLAMVRTINEIAHVMGKQTVAEFVESEAVLAGLREIGVDYAQGFHMGRSRPIGELAAEEADARPACVAD